MTINSALTDISEKRSLAGPITPAGQFEKAVVTEVLFTKSTIESIYSKYKDLIDQVGGKDRIPKNSCIVRRIARGIDTVGAESIAYPFFSSHLALPVKVGETVWVMSDREIKTIVYWISRVHGDDYSEDLNYSHHDRSIPPSQELTSSPKTKEKADKGSNQAAKTKAQADDFPNINLKQNVGANEYDNIIESSNTSKFASLEPVPRYSRRPGDFIIHGSNNSMISLGTDRYWKKEDDPLKSQNSSLNDIKEFSGAIDLVAGRSRGLMLDSFGRTTPVVFKNSRDYKEVLKNYKSAKEGSSEAIIGVSGTPGETSQAGGIVGGFTGDIKTNLGEDWEKSLPFSTEGDPDFYFDASRIYISMNTNIDESLSLLEYTPYVPGEDGRRAPSDGAGAFIKSDHVRIVGRKDDAFGINGTIKIIKEGELSNDGDGCSISLLGDGVIHIAAPRIHLGLSTANGGDADRDKEESGISQPYIKYQQLKELLEKILSDLDKFCDKLNTHTTPGYGAPSVQILQAAAELKAGISARKSEIPSVKSLRIFGE